MSFAILPDELKLQIFSNLDAYALSAANRVSCDWHRIAQDPSLAPNYSTTLKNNILEGRFTKSPAALPIYNAYSSVLHLENGELRTKPLPSYGGNDYFVQIDPTKYQERKNYVSSITLQAGEVTYQISNFILYKDNVSTGHMVLDVGCLNGIVFCTSYHYPNGLYILNDDGTLKEIAKNYCGQIVCDEKNGCLYAAQYGGSIDKLDFKHVKQEKPASIVARFASAFFKSIKDEVVKELDWKKAGTLFASLSVGAFVFGSISVIMTGSLVLSLISASLFMGFFMTMIFIGATAAILVRSTVQAFKAVAQT